MAALREVTDPSAVERAITIATDAFAHDHFQRWVIGPDQKDFEQWHGYMMRQWCMMTKNAGKLYECEDMKAVAFILPPGTDFYDNEVFHQNVIARMPEI